MPFYDKENRLREYNNTTNNTIVANAAYDNNIRYWYGDSYSRKKDQSNNRRFRSTIC